MFFEECVMSHDEELHFLRAEQNSHLFRLILALAVLLALVAFGANRYAQHQKAVRNAEAANAAERKWFAKTVDKIARLRVALNDADAGVSAVTAANSKPIRKGGKAVPQEKWSEEGAAQYRVMQNSRVLIANSQDNLVAEYNKRRAAYTGEWPKGQASGNAGNVSVT